MSRVRKPDNKWCNMPKHSSEFYNALPMIRSKGPDVHPEKAATLSSWLFLKYDMSYKSFSRKSKSRKDALRKEYESETGNTINNKRSEEPLDCDLWNDDM